MNSKAAIHALCLIIDDDFVVKSVYFNNTYIQSINPTDNLCKYYFYAYLILSLLSVAFFDKKKMSHLIIIYIKFDT